MNGIKLLGSISVLFGLLFLILPMLSTPVIKGLSFWKASFQIDDMKIEVRTGLWGTCTYYRNFDSSIRKHGWQKNIKEWDDDYEVQCTKTKAGYSFRISSTVPDGAGELSSTQTLFVLIWLILIAFIAFVALALSFSPNYYQWKHAAILALTSGILGFGIFLACVVIFTGLTRETRATESAKTIPLSGSLQGDSFFPLSGSVLLLIGAGLLWTSFRNEFFKLHRRSTAGGEDEKRMSLKSGLSQPLPPATLGTQGVHRHQSQSHEPMESRRGTEIPRGPPANSAHHELNIEEDSTDTELEEIKAPRHSSDADDELNTEIQSQSSLQDDSFTGNSRSYAPSSVGLPPPPPLKSFPANRFVTKKFR